MQGGSSLSDFGLTLCLMLLIVQFVASMDASGNASSYHPRKLTSSVNHLLGVLGGLHSLLSLVEVHTCMFRGTEIPGSLCEEKIYAIIQFLHGNIYVGCKLI